MAVEYIFLVFGLITCLIVFGEIRFSLSLGVVRALNIFNMMLALTLCIHFEHSKWLVLGGCMFISGIVYFVCGVVLRRFFEDNTSKGVGASKKGR